MQDLRRVPFLVGALLLALALLVELGVDQGAGEVDREDLRGELAELNREADPPGLAIGYLALVDGLLLFSVGLLVAALFLPLELHARLQAVASLIVSFLVLLGGIVFAILAFVELILMVAMFLAAPFGTLAYLALFGFFDRAGAAVALTLITSLKLGFAACLVVAQPRFLRSKGLVLLVLTSLLASVIVSFLHGFVPIVLVSITDALAALIVAILGIVWALVLLVLSIVSLVKALT